MVVGEGERGQARADEGQLGSAELGALQGEAAGVGEDAVLEGRVDVEGDGGAGVEGELGAQERGEGAHRRGLAEKGAEEDPDGSALGRTGVRHVVLEVARGVAGVVGQGHPQLDAVQHLGAGCGDLGVAMPRPPVMRFISPGRTSAWLPPLSRCSTSPANSQLTVCRPVCGWGGTSMPPEDATSSGP